MARYIDADILINELGDCTLATWGKGLGASWWAQSVKLKDNMVECINNQPTADVAEVKHGHWIYHPDDLFPAESEQECSICHEREDITLVNDNYCPNCGAKMDGKEP